MRGTVRPSADAAGFSVALSGVLRAGAFGAGKAVGASLRVAVFLAGTFFAAALGTVATAGAERRAFAGAAAGAGTGDERRADAAWPTYSTRS
ncbi:hypothetical protein FQZ97_1060540 [compost metagenome]